MNSHFQLVLALFASLGLSACASTQLSHTWKDETYTSGPLKKLLIVAVRKNQQTKHDWEDGFVAALSKHGVDVTPSYRLLSESLPDSSIIDSITREGGFDGIILIGKVTTGEKTAVTGGLDLTSPEFSSRPWDGWYYAYYDREYHPGYPVIGDIAKDEIKVWAIQGGGRMIWTGVGEVEGSDRHEDVRRAIIQLFVPELVQQGVVDSGS